jgi:3-phenylpropionate/trans-cinnamate dioxygenase ferredoxin subunit
MRFVKVATVDQIPEGEPMQVYVDDRPIALVRCEGTVFAVSDICTHEEEYMSAGFVEDCMIECPRHGSQFDVRTGKVLSLPATEDLPTYPVKLKGDDVLVGVQE